MQHGETPAWRPEWRPKGGKWQIIPTERNARGHYGVPGPLYFGGAIAQIGLCGYEQAMALAWAFAAHAAATGREVEVRAAEYDLHFDIKARKLSDAAAVQESALSEVKPDEAPGT